MVYNIICDLLQVKIIIIYTRAPNTLGVRDFGFDMYLKIKNKTLGISLFWRRLTDRDIPGQL